MNSTTLDGVGFEENPTTGVPGERRGVNSNNSSEVNLDEPVEETIRSKDVFSVALSSPESD
jgi:hypothetical protein